MLPRISSILFPAQGRLCASAASSPTAGGGGKKSEDGKLPEENNNDNRLSQLSSKNNSNDGIPPQEDYVRIIDNESFSRKLLVELAFNCDKCDMG